MAWVCVNGFGTELIFETEPHKAVYSWRDDYGSCKCIELPKGSIKNLIGRELSWDDEAVELKQIEYGQVIIIWNSWNVNFKVTYS